MVYGMEGLKDLLVLLQVRLCHGGQWRTELVDDSFPVTQHGMLAYCKAARYACGDTRSCSFQSLSHSPIADNYTTLLALPISSVLQHTSKR